MTTALSPQKAQMLVRQKLLRRSLTGQKLPRHLQWIPPVRVPLAQHDPTWVRSHRNRKHSY